jgi:rSAM/selenodomain-associated transferase 1
VTAAIGVMARAPSAPGKTRLAARVSASRLAALRVALVRDVFAAVARLSQVDAFVFFTPDEAEPEMTALLARPTPCIRQGPGDLGERMRSAFDDLIGRRGYEAAMLIGTDMPFLGADAVAEAREILQARGGVVLGPADDGGYYLIGMTQRHPGLFEQIAWGTASVLTDTLRAADRLGVEARLIRGAYDIDTIEDLHRLERDLASAPATVSPNVRRWFADGRQALSSG